MALQRRLSVVTCAFFLALVSLLQGAQAADRELLLILKQNGVITEEQYQRLIGKESLTTQDILPAAEPTVVPEAAPEAPREVAPALASGPWSETVPEVSLDENTQTAINDAVARAIAAESPIEAGYGSKGFRFATRDGKFETNLQWRAQLRYSNPFGADPRQIEDFEQANTSSFEARRLRMKIGGHGFQPWIKYYFEVDLQPARDVDADATTSGARVIDYRIDLANWDWGGLRLGQWKVDLNRERVDSSGRQQFVERSIVNRIFTIDRQVGLQLRGRLFKGTLADLNYYAGVFNGEGRSVRNVGLDVLYMGRLQWNFFGRELAWRQTDVEFTEAPTGSFAVAGFSNVGPCTRWSSTGCGNLDGFAKVAQAQPDQFRIEQGVQEFAFKYRGFSFQQEWHRKFITDRVEGTQSDLTGAYVQAGYFFNNLIDAFPAPLELAARYAYVEEPSEFDRAFYNEREEITLGANWFFKGHSNKLTLDVSHLTLDDSFLNASSSERRVRLQWDVSF